MRIFTGSYDNCKLGDLVSISGDKEEELGLQGIRILNLASKKNFEKYGMIILEK